MDASEIVFFCLQLDFTSKEKLHLQTVCVHVGWEDEDMSMHHSRVVSPPATQKSSETKELPVSSWDIILH